MNQENVCQTVKHWPKSERPRERLLAQGPRQLSDAELLAVLLRSGIRGKDVVQMSRELIAQAGGLRQLFRLGWPELRRVKGLGPAKIATLLAALELSRRQFKEEIIRKDVIKDPQAVFDYLYVTLGDCRKEIFKVLYLNKANQLIAEKDLFFGTVDEAAIHPREVVQSALEEHATAVILVHNHPSGRTEPSQEDMAITKKLKAACEVVGIKVLDHLIVGNRNYFSFNENHLMV